MEFAHPEPEKLDVLFRSMGYEPVAQHTSRDFTLYRQGDITYVLNRDPYSHAAAFTSWTPNMP